MASLAWGGFGGFVFLIAMLIGMVLAPKAQVHLDAFGSKA